jgi:hypothetical protein
MIMLWLLLLVSTQACVLECGHQHTDFFLANWREDNVRTFYFELPIDDECPSASSQDLHTEFSSLTANMSIDKIVEVDDNITQCYSKIRGNYVAISPLWSKQLKKLCCQHATAERVIVFGPRYAEALATIIECCDETKKWEITEIALGSFLGIGAVISVLLLHAKFMRKKYEETEDEQLPLTSIEHGPLASVNHGPLVVIDYGPPRGVTVG